MASNESNPDQAKSPMGRLKQQLDKLRASGVLPSDPYEQPTPAPITDLEQPEVFTFEQQVYQSVALTRRLRSENKAAQPAPPEKIPFTFPDGFTIRLDFELNDQQKAALESIAEWAVNPNIPVYGLKGYAGTGKTTIMRLAVEYLTRKLNMPVVLAAPTHRAKQVLARAAGKFVGRDDCMTLHTMLRLRPTFDMEELDLKNLDFNREGEDKIPSGGAVIVDEVSMINDGLAMVLVSICEKKKCKLLFVGDPAQLKPVKQDTLSLAFNTRYNSELTQVMRQKNGNPISYMLEAIRSNQLVVADSYARFDRLSPTNQGIIFTNSAVTCREWISKHLLAKQAQTDRNYVRVLCGTNKMVQNYNASIRSVLYAEQALEEYMPGELLTGYSNYGQDATFQPLITNSADYIVREAVPQARELLPDMLVQGWWVTLIDSDSDIPLDRRLGKSLFIISRHESHETLMLLGQHLRELQREAKANAKLKKKGAWDPFHRFKESFCLATDYAHGEYTLLRKTIDYGYALTVHKS